MAHRTRRFLVVSSLVVAGGVLGGGTAHATIDQAPGCTTSYSGQAVGDASVALPGLAPSPYIGIAPGAPVAGATELQKDTQQYKRCIS
jgi:hypothetical protein